MLMHVGLHVVNLEASVSFYTHLFGREPVKRKADYAKFLPENLQLNFTLNKAPAVSGNQVGHFGIQVENLQELDQHRHRLEQTGFSTHRETDTSCCYALQDKFWITDPDGNQWEFFYTKQDVEKEKQQPCCS